MKLRDLFARAVKPIVHERFQEVLAASLPDEDDAQPELSVASVELTSIVGLGIFITYRSADGVKSKRVITCKSLSERDTVQYLKAYCHKRKAVRVFRVDRIVDVCDAQSGEVFSPVAAFFDRFQADRIAKSGLSWGLSVKRRADLVALFNALVFLARCDREYHQAEHSVLEQALTNFWLRLELPGDPDFNDILKYAKKLSPDGETFWLAMDRFRADERLAAVFKSNARRLVEADHVVRQEEAYWLLEIQDFLESS